METAARNRGLALAARVLERSLNADPSDAPGPRLPCPTCPQQARYAGRSPKTFQSLLGPLTLRRAYYHCQACGRGFCPRDQAWGLAGTSHSPGLARVLGLTAAHVSFAETRTLVWELAGVRVTTKRVERTALALGQEIAAREREAVVPEPPAAPTVYVGLDGTGVPMRPEETQGRVGKQPDGSAKSREGKLLVTWTAETRTPEGRPQRDWGSVRYSAAIESAACRDTDPEIPPFQARVRRAAQRGGFGQATRSVVLGDGAAWIWRLAQEEFPGAIQIVDLWHAKEHPWEVSQAIHGPGEVADAWARARCDELDAGDLPAVLAALRPHVATCADARKCRDFIERNRARMQYAEFRAQGLCVGSGVVEAGCKTVVGQRLKRSGMRWTLAGANAMLALRSCILSGGYEDFWEQRAGLT